jgi:hypothetical protein
VFVTAHADHRLVPLERAVGLVVIKLLLYS